MSITVGKQKQNPENRDGFGVFVRFRGGNKKQNLARLQADAEWKNGIRRRTNVRREVLFFHSRKNIIKKQKSR